ncbi:LCP family protein [bacterium]|nr:LCP family protein [bacterium]
MSEYKINLVDGIKPLEKIENIEEKTRSRKSFSRIFFRFAIVFLVIVIFFSTNTIFSGNGAITNLGKLSFWEGVARLTFKHDKILKGELNDRINILLLGIGGKAHPGPYLTDTIILVSIKPSEQKIALLSIPRDLYVPIRNYSWRKVNEAYLLGLSRDEGGELPTKTIENILDLSIPYWVVIDFSAFEELIDFLGGIDVYVERSFVDNQFPTVDFKYRVVSFEKGWQKMDGKTALDYARSRHGNNNEGTDFARARRQQKVILAIMKKIKQEDILEQPRKIFKIYNIFSKKIDTNINFSESIKLAKILKHIPEKNINRYVFDTNFLYPEITKNGVYILKTKTGDFSELANFAKNVFEEKTITKEIQKSRETEKAKLIVLNGTYISGLAKRTKIRLEKEGFKILKIGNAPKRGYKENIIYNLTNKNANKLKKLLNDAETKTNLPKDLEVYSNCDFLIILGENRQ